MILDRLEIDAERFTEATGWVIKPDGACRGEVCVPLGGAWGGLVDVAVVAERLGMGLVRDDELALWALGPESLSGRGLSTAVAPELVLPDLVSGTDFRLSTLRGEKVVLACWAPY